MEYCTYGFVKTVNKLIGYGANGERYRKLVPSRIFHIESLFEEVYMFIDMFAKGDDTILL